MPIHVFHCADCGEEFERLLKLSDHDPRTCPHCGKHHVRRQMSAPAFRLAGSGWYETDFKSSREHKYNLAGNSPPKADAVGGNGTGTAEKSAKSSKPAAAGDSRAAAAD